MNNEVTIVPIGDGGGWYHITKNGYVKAIARGMAQAQKKAEEVKHQPQSSTDIFSHVAKMIKQTEE